MQAARRRERLIPYLLIAPSLVFLAAFFLIPLAEALLVSFRAGAATGSATTSAWPPTSTSPRR